MTNSTNEGIVLTLDAGGTNLVFNAISNYKTLFEDFSIPTEADDLDKCLANIVRGFAKTIEKCPTKPIALSFAFPGPADYANGVIGGFLPNFPSFRHGVALGPYLKEIFQVPVFINNDGDLFAYGEAIHGALPEINENFRKKGFIRRYKNLLGITLGTGTGGGVVRNGELFIGDNNAAAEVCRIRNKKYPYSFVEEGANITAIKRTYRLLSGDNKEYTPKDIAKIATGVQAGDKAAAVQTFVDFGEVLGDLIANILTVIDGIVVIGGGIAASHKLFMPQVMKELNGSIYRFDKTTPIPRLPSVVYDLTEPESAEEFYQNKITMVNIPYSQKKVPYIDFKKTAITISKLGASQAVHIGAYALAIRQVVSG